MNNRELKFNLRLLLTAFILLINSILIGQKGASISTSDIRNFWKAYDQLDRAVDHEDSIRIIQVNYIDQASVGFKKFIRVRQFSAPEYVKLIARYPVFWASVRPHTEAIEKRTEELEQILDSLALIIPGYKRPDICFAIGCLRTGGTASGKMLLIGSEIAASDSTVDKSEMSGWLEDVIGTQGDITAMVAHESIHTQQSGFPFFEIFKLVKHRSLSLLNHSIMEGSCDYITRHYLGLNINASLTGYGDPHFCELMTEFQKDMTENPYDISNWLYNGNDSRERPADLGYYIGYRITEEYFRNSDNERKAMKRLLKLGKYRKVYKISEVWELCD